MVRAAISLALLVALAGCHKETCPELAALAHSNPLADAQAAAARGDHRLLMLGGYVGVVPGAEGTSAPTRLLPGTSDTNTVACDELRSVAERDALAYNRTLLRGQGSRAP